MHFPCGMSDQIRLRDVVRKSRLELGSEVCAYRVSYDLLFPDGPIRIMSDGLVEWFSHGEPRTSRIVATTLGQVRAGERVLVRLDNVPHQWWLCDVETEAPGADGGEPSAQGGP